MMVQPMYGASDGFRRWMISSEDRLDSRKQLLGIFLPHSFGFTISDLILLYGSDFKEVSNLRLMEQDHRFARD